MSNIERLEAIKNEMKELLDEAKRLVLSESREQGQNIIYQRAKSYWIGHIATALDSDSDYLSSKSDVTFEKTIEELRPGAKSNQDDEEE